MHKGKAEVPF